MARSSSSSRVLTDRDEIRMWAEERGAKPAHVQRTGGGNDVGMIRLDFPGYSGEGSLEQIEWDDWFDKFEESGLALIVQDTATGGQKSNFNKLVSRDSVEQSSGGRSGPAGRSGGEQSSRRSSSRVKSSSGSKSSSRGQATSSRSGNSRQKRASRAAQSTNVRGKRKSGSGTSRTSTRRKTSAASSTKATGRKPSRATQVRGRKASGRSSQSRRKAA